MSMKKEKIAKGIRVLSVPPVMVSVMILILARVRGEIFRNTDEIIVTLLLLGIVPVLAYPMQHFIKGLRKQGREGQRKLAFVCSLIGYTAAFLWSLGTGVMSQLRLICNTYFFSVVLLTFCNKVLHFRASGHACSFTGPLLLLIYFVGYQVILPCVAAAALILWSSLYMKRHTAKELLGGMGVCVVAFTLAMLVLQLGT